MNILILSQYFYPETFSINEIAVFLQKQGHKVDVVTGIPNYPKGKFFDGYGYFSKMNETYKGVNVQRVILKPRGERGGDKRLALNYITYAIFASFKMILSANKEYDVIFVYAMSPITQAYPALLFKRIKQVPICLYVGDLWPDTLFSHGFDNVILKKILMNMCSKIYKNSDSIIVVNKSYELPVYNYNNKKKNVKYIPQWADEIYKPKIPKLIVRNLIKAENDDFLVMFAGNIGYAQSVETIIKSAAILKRYSKIKFVFIGDGSLRKECETMCEKKGLKNCYFIGRRLPQDMPDLIADSNVMLVSLKNQNNYNLTLPGRTQAFMACAKPLIACANGETARIVLEAKAGMVCEAENENMLAKTILEMYKLPELNRDQYGLNGAHYCREHYDKFSILKNIEKVLIKLNEAR